MIGQPGGLDLTGTTVDLMYATIPSNFMSLRVVFAGQGLRRLGTASKQLCRLVIIHLARMWRLGDIESNLALEPEIYWELDQAATAGERLRWKNYIRQ